MKPLSQTLSLVLLVAALRTASAQELFIYDNTITETGTFLNGGTADQGGNLITRLVADDITPAPGFAGVPLLRVYFAVVNNNAVAVSARPRIRFYGSDGAGGGPGTYITGFTFNPISFPASGGSAFYFTPTGMNVPSGTFWAGMTFDNNTGGTGATLAQMDNLGLALFNPPGIGTSADVLFQTTAAGSFLVSNPAGTLFNFSGDPLANAYFGFSVVPEPTTATLFALGGIVSLILRRRTRD